MPSRFLTTVAACAALTVVASCAVRAPVPDDWRARGSVAATVAFAPGGGSDRSARVLAEGLNGLDHGYDVNVENKEGGSGAVGWATFKSEEGNGNALLVAETALNTLPIVYPDVPFTYRDFTPLVMFAQDSRMVVAPKDSPFSTCADVVRASATRRVVAGSSGKTGADSLVVAELKKAGGKVDVVPYGSTGEVLTGLLGGRIDLAPASAAAAKPYIESGDAKALCTMTDKRYADPVLGAVPTAREQGIDALVTIWRGVLAPAGITPSQRRYWIDEVHAAMASPAYRDYIAGDLLIPADISGDAFSRYLDDYDRRMQEVF